MARQVVCDRGACYYSVEVEVPSDPAAAKAVIDEAMASHRQAHHGEGAPAPTSAAPPAPPAEPAPVPEDDAPPPPDEHAHRRRRHQPRSSA